MKLDEKELELIREFRFAGNPTIDPYANDPDMRDLRDRAREARKRQETIEKLKVNQAR